MEKKDIDYIIQVHNGRSQKPENRFRKWDKKTPYYIHPIWCATMIMYETSLPEDIRLKGSLALLYHDILEDTTADLPQWLAEDVKILVSELTFKSSENEWSNLWDKDKRVRLLKLYDKVSNLMDGVWMKNERRQQYLTHLRKLCEDVEENYGELNITRITRALL